MTKKTIIRQTCPQVKVCGLTIPKQALLCARLGVDAIGLVFFEESPRNVTREQASAICDAVGDSVAKIGVFVDASYNTIISAINECGLSGVQLHGKETPALVKRLVKNGIKVIKSLYINAEPNMNKAHRYGASAYLLECAGGRLPGGNALSWNWETARAFSEKYPLVLAGGIKPENVVEAMQKTSPGAIDVSSGVEEMAGKKNLSRVSKLIHLVHRTKIDNGCRRIF
ncbi:MAG: phosphoribosylanthranilate isomerase [Deltaproteobacteria bacterium]|nr:phosphoribosylanthranilate isomerase [Deltaproteobacteria bacterium]